MNYGNIPQNILLKQINEEQKWDDTCLTLKEALDEIGEDIEFATWILRDSDPDHIDTFHAWTKKSVLFLNESMCEWYVSRLPRNPPEGK